MVEDKIVFLVVGILIILGIGIGITLDAFEVSGANNDSLFVKVNITNTEPDLYRIVVRPVSPIDLTAGNTTVINCTGWVYDRNGWQDITVANATIYDINDGGYDPDPTTADNSSRYFNETCDCTQVVSTNASCTCLFPVWYFANNGTWQCNMSIADSYNLTDSMNSSSFTINTVIGINVPNEIDYGNLSVTETSDNISVNISNWGNVPINVSVRGWGGTDDYSAAVNDSSMICETGNISWYYERYTVDPTEPFEDMTNITNTSVAIPSFDIQVRNESKTDNNINISYWAIYIPLGIGGACNGTIEFSATETTI